MPGRFASRFSQGGAPPDPAPAAESHPEAHAAPPPPPPRIERPVSADRARQDLIRLRELELRDVGGLAAEMARRNDWRYPLLHSRTADVLALEERIHELDQTIAAGAMAARGVGVATCQCGAPIIEGSHFCAHCGRPARDTPPVVTCSHCGAPVPAEANFCTVCGNAVAADDFEPTPLDQTMVEPRPEEG